jgi:tRNA-Thr(GGU) m(6)t(6)A37 methyltransferase TsaA
MEKIDFMLTPIGVVESALSSAKDAPCQGFQGAPDAWINIDKKVIEGMRDIHVGDKIIVITWLHLSDRRVLEVHPQDNKKNQLTSVFATRSADRPNPIGLHPVTVLQIAEDKINVAPLEAIHGTPVIDIKPVI